MEVAVPEEPKKKIFCARKTMKMSDRQQLKALHNTLTTSSSTSNPSSSSLVNGTHGEKEKEKVKKNDLNHKETDVVSPAADSSHSSPSPSDSPSPAPPNKQTTSPSSVKNGLEKKRDEKNKGVKAKNDSKDGGKNVDVKADHKEACKSDRSSSSETPKKEDLNEAEKEKRRGEEMAPMDVDEALVTTASYGDRSEEKKDASIKSFSSSLSSSPSSGLDCDPEIKEGFLCLSEEDDVQAEKDDRNQSEEKMTVDAVKEEEKDEKDASENTGADNSASAGTKRSLSEEKDDDKELKNERDGKRARLEGEELEAQLELKITATGGSRHKLEKMVQQLVEERLRVLQLTVFDHSIKELKDRVEKIDSAAKQQNALQHITTLQAKIARLAKKFGAANQASENAKTYTAAQATNATNLTQTASLRPYTCEDALQTALDSEEEFTFSSEEDYDFSEDELHFEQRLDPAEDFISSDTVKTTMDPKLSGPATGSANSAAIPAQPKPLSTPTTPTSSALASPAPILQIISTSTSSTPSSTSLTGQSQTGALLLKTGPSTGVMTTTSATSGGQPMSIQPLLIQLPLAVANGQSGALVNAAGSVGLIPVSSLSTVTSLNKAKTTTPATTFILPKAAGSVASSVSSSSPAMSLARAAYPGGTGTVSSPSTGISVTSARTPAQCAAVVGVSTAACSPGTTGPAATGSAPAAAGPVSASALASKTDNQASSKTASQPGRPKGSVIDLTEDDDDVQVTGVQKARISPITQRATSLVSTTPNAGSGVRTVQRTSVDSPSLSRPSPSSSTSLPPLPLAPSTPARLPPEAAQTSPPQQPQLKLARVQSQNGIVLSWCVAETDRSCAAVDTYHLYAYHQDHQGAVASTGASAQLLWKKIGEVKALPLPMACTLTQFVSGSTYYFAVRAKDVYGRFGPFCEPQCTDVINPASS